MMSTCNTELPRTMVVPKMAKAGDGLRRRPLVSSEKSNAISPKNPSTPNSPRRCPSPKRGPSAERRPSTTPSSPSSRSSAPSSELSRSGTPVRDSVIEADTTPRRSIDGLWPSMRSLSSSFRSEKKEKMIGGSSSDQSNIQANGVIERKRTPLRGRNTSDQSTNPPLLDTSHSKLIDQRRWPAMIGGELSGNAMSKSLDLTDKAKKSASLSVSSRGVSLRRMSFDGNVRAEQKIGFGPNVASSHALQRSSSFTRSSRNLSSSISGSSRPSSPGKALSNSPSASRGTQSPSRTRPSSPARSSSLATGRAGAASSVLNYIVDSRKGKKNTGRIDDAHQLRLLHNRDLQWRFVNAHAEETLPIHKMSFESILYSMWDATSKLRDSVVAKRVDVQHLRQEMKLSTILIQQIDYLEQWATLEREHRGSLPGAIEALKASTLRLPVTRGARADIRAVKNAVSSAVDVMQLMGSSICYLLSKVEDTNTLVSELSVVAAKESVMLDECRELLATAAALQVQESSLRTQLIQIRHERLTLE